MLLIASSASRSYHSKGAEFGDGNEAAIVSGDKSNRSSGESPKSRGSISVAIDFCLAEYATLGRILVRKIELNPSGPRGCVGGSLADRDCWTVSVGTPSQL
jgi:hypothetical protein